MKGKDRALLIQALSYGGLAAALLICLHLLRSSYWLFDLRLELYLLLAGIPLMAAGVYLGRRLDRGTKPHSPVMTTDSALSAKELAVLAEVAAGLSNQQIADRLYLSISTVKSHLRNIYGKLGVQRRTQAVEHARKLSLLP